MMVLNDCMDKEISRLAYGVTFNKESFYHTWSHTLRVARYAAMIYQSESYEEEKFPEILVASYFHDTGRIFDAFDGEHGYRSVQILDACKDRLSFEFDIDSVRFAILNHSERRGEAGALPVVENFERDESIDKRIAACLWDADRLDLLRLPFVTEINPEYLNTRTARDYANTTEHLKIYNKDL